MITTTDILTRVLEHFPLPTEVFAPESNFWLTLYLSGDACSYAKAQAALEAKGWGNFDDTSEYSGFVYPKIEVPNDAVQASNTLAAALFICDKVGMEVNLIDADTAFNPSEPIFKTLYK